MKQPGHQKMLVALSAVAAFSVLAALSGCGERPQVLTHAKNDVPAYEGADNQYPAPAWTRGDKTSWEKELKSRMWNSQNEYTKLTVSK